MTATRFFSKTRLMLLLLTTCFLLADRFGLLASLERMTYDLGVRFSLRPMAQRIIQIGVDSRSLAAMEQGFQDPRYDMRLIRALAPGNPRLVVDTRGIGFEDDQTAMEILIEAKKKLDSSDFQSRADRELAQTLFDLEKKLAEGMQKIDRSLEYGRFVGGMGNVILSIRGIPRTSDSSPRIPLRREFLKHALSTMEAGSLPTGMPELLLLQAPPPEIAKHVLALGMLSVEPDSDSVVRSSPLGHRVGEAFFPSLALSVAARSLNIQTSEIKFQPGRSIVPGTWDISRGFSDTMLTFFYHDAQGQSPFPMVSLIDVLEDKVPVATFRNQIVLIGDTAPGLIPRYPTPLGQPLAPVELLAHEVATLLNQDAFKRPSWTDESGWIMIVSVGAALVLFMPWLSPFIGGVTGMGVAVLGWIGAIHLMMHHSLWIPWTGPALFLFSGSALILATSREKRRRDRVVPRSEMEDGNKMLGLALQGQEAFSLAFERFRQCRLDESTLEMLHHLAVVCAETGCFPESIEILEYLEQKSPGYRDCGQRLAEMRATISAGATGDDGEPHVALIPGKLELLDRYRLEEELGRGLFGTVWNGIDDTQHREVAIKIIPLQERFPDGTAFSRAKSLFGRMADQCQSLRHPNIIRTEETQILDGQGIVVMERCPGQSLARHVTPGQLLPLPTVIQIVAKAAMALDHAHRLRIVHGNLKPENIIHDDVTQEIKLTGFAQYLLLEAISEDDRQHPWHRVNSLLAPEQRSGNIPDRRSDIHALGRIFSQLITGQTDPAMATPPEHSPPASTPASIPDCLDRIIHKCLEPQPENRYPGCIELARDLVACIKSRING
ncbi:MAG: CHASE2 domain-containing protein [Magnetococcales bacterium]|nr:CHASE2 domain-containing protein [Magnetococcales bacterium]